jgi:hypothetical protein
VKFVPGSPASVFAFVVIVIAVLAAFLAAVHRAYRGEPARAATVTFRTAVITAVWLAFLGFLVGTHRLERLPMYGLPFFFGAVAAISLGLGLSSLGGRIAASVPLAALVGFQAFRLPLELVLHAWAEQGTIPVTMTWTGRNWDIISGIVALVACFFANRHRGAAWIANIVGAVLLVNVMRVALLSAPVPFGWHVEPPLLVALNLPYMYIGPVCVGGAIAGHVILTRALLRPAPVLR